MLAVLFTLALFLVWSALGLAALTAFGADVKDLRVALTAPILGTALTAVPLFILNNAGVPMEVGAPPVIVSLLVGATLALTLRRPRLSPAVIPVVLICLADLLLLGRPMFQFSFDWIANANGDMAFYVLSATNLLDHGLRSAVDVSALAQNRGFSTSAQQLTLSGLRPGTQITLAGLAASTGRAPLALYMPMSIAVWMGTVCATGALAMQASRRWWAASVAAALLVASPLGAYGVLQQLLPQNWGLGLAAALFAWLLRPELYRERRPALPDMLVICFLAAALFVVYYEVAVSLSLACVLYVAFLAVRRQVSVRGLAFAWGVPLLVTALVVNSFLPRALRWIADFVVPFGASSGLEDVSQFGYAIVPTALPGATGLRSLFEAPHTPNMSWFILAAAGLVAGLVVASARIALKGAAAGFTVLTGFALAALLARNGNAYGLFKLYMYMQPFVAAAAAVWLAGLKDRRATVATFGLLAVVVGAQLPVLNAYVDRSRNPVDLRNASRPDLLPKFRELLEDAQVPVITITDNFALQQLEGASVGDKQLFFVSRNLFSLPWQKRRFDVPSPGGARRITFDENEDASRLLSRGSCVVAFPSGSEGILNRRTFPEGSPSLLARRCGRAKNTLAFVVSSLGQPATLPDRGRDVSFWQLESDPTFPGRTFSGFGRYALFQVLDTVPGVRVALELTTSPTQSGNEAYRIPPAAIVGAGRVPLPVVGSGSARVFSDPLRPKLIGGQPYVVLDMGRAGEAQRVPRPGLTDLWGESVSLDPRFLTSYVRDVSLMPANEYGRIDAPAAIRNIPADLANPELEYSGIYEDGWIGSESYAHLAGGRVTRLTLRADVLPRRRGQRLRVIVNGQPVASQKVAPGPLELEVAVPASAGRRKIELHWLGVSRLALPDRRSAAARLTFLGVAGS